jgi:hypothetical protein
MTPHHTFNLSYIDVFTAIHLLIKVIILLYRLKKAGVAYESIV